jgi:hypothetical protein
MRRHRLIDLLPVVAICPHRMQRIFGFVSTNAAREWLSDFRLRVTLDEYGPAFYSLEK